MQVAVLIVTFQHALAFKKPGYAVTDSVDECGELLLILCQGALESCLSPVVICIYAIQKQHIKVNSTTFMVQLLTKLGLDTGFTTEEIKISNKANAGMEMGIYERWDKATKTRVPNPQYIVKSPMMCDKLDQALKFNNVIINHVYIPVREIDSVIASWVWVGEGTGGYLDGFLQAFKAVSDDKKIHRF